MRTLTKSPGRASELREKIEVMPLAFDDPGALTESLRGAAVLYNTYWVRFNHRTFTFRDAVRNTRTLFAAAKAAGVGRIVHVSITNPDAAERPSSLEYFAGKGVLEKELRELGVPYAILRPAVFFGKEDILVNNIAWLLRRMPVFGVFGDGEYRLQPIYVDDLAAVAVEAGGHSGDEVIEAIGPETFTYRGLVARIGEIIGRRRRIVGVAPGLGYAVSKLVNPLVGDVLITRDEIRGLMENRLYVPGAAAPALAVTKLTEWAAANREWLGSRYASELGRRRDRVGAYTR